MKIRWPCCKQALSIYTYDRWQCRQYRRSYPSILLSNSKTSTKHHNSSTTINNLKKDETSVSRAMHCVTKWMQGTALIRRQVITDATVHFNNIQNLTAWYKVVLHLRHASRESTSQHTQVQRIFYKRIWGQRLIQSKHEVATFVQANDETTRSFNFFLQIYFSVIHTWITLHCSRHTCEHGFRRYGRVMSLDRMYPRLPIVTKVNQHCRTYLPVLWLALLFIHEQMIFASWILLIYIKLTTVPKHRQFVIWTRRKYNLKP